MTANNDHWKNTSYLLLSFIIGMVVSFLAYNVFTKGSVEPKTIVVYADKNGKSIKTSIDSIAILKLQTDIQLVEKKNDGRFEVLTWSSVLILTLLLVFITINYLISSAKVRELVDIEIDKKTGEIQRITNNFEADLQKKQEDFDTIYEKAQKEYEKIIDYNLALGKTKTSKK